MPRMARTVATAVRGRRKGARKGDVINWPKFWEHEEWRYITLLPIASTGMAAYAGKQVEHVRLATAAMDKAFTFVCANAPPPPETTEPDWVDICAQVTIQFAENLFAESTVRQALRRLKPRWQQWGRRR